jgi:hypothetical protein
MSGNGGTYWKLKDDGAEWRCVSCRELKAFDKVIVFEHTETHKREVTCLECVETEWLEKASCLGVL